MSKINTTARTTESTTVRMFDGAKWDTYKRGGKKHRAAEARRAAWEATRPSKDERVAQAQARQTANKAQAAWMRENGLVPSGSAWKAVSAGERSVKQLRAMNAADGLVFRAPKAAEPKKAAKGAGKKAPAKKAAQEAPVVETPAEGTKAERKAAKRRAKAGRKAYAARVANGAAVRDEKGRFVKTGAQAPAEVPVEVPVADEAATVRKGGKKALFWADLRDVGLTDAQIEAAWAARRANA